ncbi:phospholipid phosphatase [Enterovibrio norvegicus]|uniref:bifunctional NUDIX hydrolase/phosphatase PAP2 family protein n=1 Tax=Enterovibrio norvegicus TaxID=188144 RepID=UPI0002D5C27B|nr:phosphatase PAP2 family protein [Enterovibrio norvegicus]MCC4796641.1 phosphatase PAP2 family protein [Enterovibrio norvegicus]OEF64835.1 phospholipid phosphatase [Enterovibrio norvegicus]PMH65802.1 phospholipid phosphatase [Enterovibrio norvegicus]PMI26131.1 phospholipid phosphatase [Enterovibrio norvegicus]PMI35844.1 phospholipid phosphatase [Enterovibrio norvegicus]
MMRNTLLFLFLSFISLSTLSATNDAQQIKGAACFVSDAQGRVLVTRDILNNRISIPGGYVDTDTPSDAAVRETLEETGIAVKAVRELVRQDNAIIYDCVALSPIPVHDTASQDYEIQQAAVAAWNAEHFGREVRAVYMMAPNDAMLDDARFPKQVALFPELLLSATPSVMETSPNFSHKASAFTVWNTGLNRHFQQFIERLPPSLSSLLSAGLFAVSALGNGALFFLLLPIAMATGGLKRTAGVVLVAVLVTVITHFGKLHFSVPRPFYVFPDLQRDLASGFAFPSGHTATAFAVWGLAYSWVKQTGKKALWIWLVPTALVALSRVYLGVHYVTDVLAGAVVGALSLAIVLYVSHASHRGASLLLKARLWFAVALFIAPFAATQIQPSFLYCMLLAFAFALSLCVSTRAVVNAETPLGTKGFLWSMAGMGVLAGAAFGIGQWSTSSIEILIAHASVAIALSVWLVAITPRLSLTSSTPSTN